MRDTWRHTQRAATAREAAVGHHEPVTDVVVALGAGVVGVAAVVWGAETFAAHLARAAAGLGVSAFALALLLAGAEPEELARR